MKGYNYQKILDEHCSALQEVVGKTLKKVLVQVVKPGTLIIQSIYAGSWNDQELHDCLRLGIGYYYLNDEAV